MADLLKGLPEQMVASTLAELTRLESLANPAEGCGGTSRFAPPPIPLEPDTGPVCAPPILSDSERQERLAAALADAISKLPPPPTPKIGGANNSGTGSGTDGPNTATEVSQACADGMMADIENSVMAPLVADANEAAAELPNLGVYFLRWVLAEFELGMCARIFGLLVRDRGRQDLIQRWDDLVTVPLSGVLTDSQQRLPSADDALLVAFQGLIGRIRPQVVGVSLPPTSAIPLLVPIESFRETIRSVSRGFADNPSPDVFFTGGSDPGLPTYGFGDITSGVPDAGVIKDILSVMQSLATPSTSDLSSGAWETSRQAKDAAVVRDGLAATQNAYPQVGLALVALVALSSSANQEELETWVISVRDRYLAVIRKWLRLRAISDVKAVKARVEQQLSQMKLCGKDLPASLKGQSGSTGSNGANGGTGTTAPQPPEDDSWNTFEGSDQPQPCEIRYWMKYALVLNLMGLLPVHWAVGLIVPTPPPVRVPLPIIWIPILVIPAPAMLTVVWLTINGIVVCPVVWQLRMPPIAQSDSYFLILLKGGNQLIKSGTGSAVLNPPVVNGIDTAPKVTRKLPYLKDDLPVIQRVTPTNLLLLKYAREWCSTATPFMGL